ncbi:Druantia anti-phage system protein DruA [Candidatus Kuenenia stuttgartiensis]|uniref:Druantia anti-phage system protein DruA n=1 Tax=Kuenenia stuttgartiensis TaxID=174633 RepID=UPI00146EFDFB
MERGRVFGSCYRAANWKYVGGTEGRGRKGTGADGQRRLCYAVAKEMAGGVVVVVPMAKYMFAKEVAQKRPRDWIERELGGTKLGDDTN